MKDIQYYWDIQRFHPTGNQKKAILHTDGPLFLTAGPGSGKTRVLLWRTLNLIVFKGVKPEDIFLSTFTEKAAQQLKDGLTSLLGLVTNNTGKPYDISKMSIGTVHSICRNIITDKRFVTAGERNFNPVIMDELDQYFHLYRHIWQDLLLKSRFDEENTQRKINEYFTGKDPYSRHLAVHNCISLFNRFSEEILKPEDVNPDDDIMLDLVCMYSAYLESLKQDKGIQLVDYALLQQSALDIIRKNKNAKNIFKHVIVDEYQDTNAIQEKLFFELSAGHKNICVVGDDDQALYRFRGATVENLVEFEKRCNLKLGVKPTRIDLDYNFRSRKGIVDCYTSFIDKIDWKKTKDSNEFYRIHDKNIKAFSKDATASVLTTKKLEKEAVHDQVADFVLKLKESGKINDYNQVAFLFPSFKYMGDIKEKVLKYKEALERVGIQVYAPRAGRFLDVDEAKAVIGIFIQILGRPKFSPNASAGLKKFQQWIKVCEVFGENLCKEDKALQEFIQDRKKEIEIILKDQSILNSVVSRKKWDVESIFKPEWLNSLVKAAGLSVKAKKALSNKYFIGIINNNLKSDKPFKLKNVINRATSLDWSILDLFYQICGFKHFMNLIDLAEKGIDEGPVCNLGLMTKYLSRYMEDYNTLFTAFLLDENRFVNSFFGSYLYAIYRLGESEYENSDDPFPKGRIPFITIHQSKGLEFPVVVLGGMYKMDSGPGAIEETIRELLDKEGEPLERINEFDYLRLFYVALSRAENLLVLPQIKRSRMINAFKEIFKEYEIPTLADFDVNTLPEAKHSNDKIGKNYSYSSDYLMYLKCPRNYMIFRKYGFVPSRSQTMFFGSLVHKTIEDLHDLLIANKNKVKSDA